jgi:mannose-6-phosphate isomerase-like protein (cupin superfamily)
MKRRGLTPLIRVVKEFRAMPAEMRIALMALAFAATFGAAGAAETVPAFAAGLHLSESRGPIRTADAVSYAGPVSSEILASPANGLDSAIILYTRMNAGAKKRGLYTLPVEHTYLVLSGKLNVQLGTDEFTAEKDTLVLVPANAPHQAWDASSDPVAVLEVITPASSRDLLSMMKPAAPAKIDNAKQYVRVPPPLGPLQGGVGHQGLNERVLASRETGSDPMLERLDDVPPNAGGPTSHVHPFDQVYFVTRGVMTVQYGLNHYEAPANTLVLLPRGVVHSNLNLGGTVESHITLILPEPPKGTPMGQSATLSPQGGGQRSKEEPPR